MNSTPSFSARIRKLTEDDHREAETSPFITQLMKGERSLQNYTRLVTQYRHIYRALEESVEALRATTDVAGVAELFDPALDRRTAIEQDLRALPSDQIPAQSLDPLPATLKYAQRLREVAHNPARLTAHHYLRYLGDLSGGLAIGKLMARHYGATQQQLNMYDFSTIDKPKIYKDRYRAQLNELGFSPAQQQERIDEVALGFTLNQAVFEELEATASAPRQLSATTS